MLAMCVGVMLKESGYSKLSSVIIPQIKPWQQGLSLSSSWTQGGEWGSGRSGRAAGLSMLTLPKSSQGGFRTDLKGADSQLLLPIRRSGSTDRGDPIGYFQDWEDFIVVCHSGDLWQDPMVPVSRQRARCLLLGGFIRRRRRTKYLED